MINRTYDDIQDKNNGLQSLRDELNSFDMFEAFSVNVWEYKDRILPLKMNSYDAIKKVKELDINPCIAYIDSSHLYEETKNELDLLKQHLPDTLITGDDYSNTYTGVIKAVNEFCEKEKCFRFVLGNTFIILNPNQKISKEVFKKIPKEYKKYIETDY